MKNKKLTLSFIFLTIMFLSMTFFVVKSKAEEALTQNPYDNPNLGVEDVITLYHTNMNNALNAYIKVMMTKLSNGQDPNTDPDGQATHQDGSKFTAADCLDPANANNYSTFCVSVNLLGGNTDDCDSSNTGNLSDDMLTICSLQGDALPLKGYLNFRAAMNNRKEGQIYQTTEEKNALNAWIQASSCLGVVSSICSQQKEQQLNNQAQTIYQTQKALEISANINMMQKELDVAKKTLDQTLSAYDQLKMAWPMHVKYKKVYADLEKYRDGLVNVRHQTDLFPKKFIDLTTTSCI